MTTKFPIDKPMELKEFIRLSEKCIEKDTKTRELNKKLYELNTAKDIKVNDAISAVNDLSMKEAKKTSKKRNLVVSLIVGLIYLKKGKRMQARATFDDFVLQNPDMIITQDVKLILDNM